MGGDGTVVQDEALEGLASAVNYRRWICDLVEPWLGDRNLEVGSGLGDYAADLASRGHRVTASEADPHRLAHLRERFDGSEVEVLPLELPDVAGGPWSSVVAINVLEHIEDDEGALRAVARSLEPGGRVILFVPAFPIAMSRFDLEVGHFRRYRRSSLAAALTGAGFEVEDLHHVNAPGLLAWIVLMRLLRSRPSPGLSLRMFEALVPTLQLAEHRLRPPFGQSLFAVGSRR